MRRLGAVWAGGSEENPPEPLDAAIIFASSARGCLVRLYVRQRMSVIGGKAEVICSS
jgi:propanol-preferring alcohol dehydrogenase